MEGRVVLVVVVDCRLRLSLQRRQIFRESRLFHGHFSLHRPAHSHDQRVRDKKFVIVVIGVFGFFFDVLFLFLSFFSCFFLL